MMYRGRNLDQNWIIMDNQSTVNMFINLKLIKNIQDLYLEVSVHLSDGETNCDQQGMILGFGDIYIHEEGIANILSFALVQDIGYRIMHNAEDGILIIQIPRK